LIVCTIIIDVLAMIRVRSRVRRPFRNAVHRRQGRRGVGVCAGIRGRLWSVAGHCHWKPSSAQDRIDYASQASASSISWHSCRRRSRWSRASALLMLSGVLPFFAGALFACDAFALLAALHAERRTLVGCLVS
jgi:hypothetical protein